MQQPANARNRFIGIFGFIALIIIIVLGVIKAGDMGVGRSVAQFPNISTGNKSNILLDSNSTDAQPSKGPNINIPDVVADTGGAGPQDLARVVKGWATEARDNIEKIQQESTMQSIAMMADYDSNYLKLITQAQMRPALPESIDFIVKSRRFAKIVQQIHDGDQTSLRVETIAQLNLDIDHWKYLKSHGQDINAEVIQLSGLPGSEPGNLIVPLNLRINAILLLLAQNPKAEDISIVLMFLEKMLIMLWLGSCRRARSNNCPRRLLFLRQRKSWTNGGNGLPFPR